MIATDHDRDSLRFDLPVRRDAHAYGVFRHHSCGQGPRAVAVGGAAQVIGEADRLAVSKAKSAEIEKFERKKTGARAGVRHVS